MNNFERLDELINKLKMDTNYREQEIKWFAELEQGLVEQNSRGSFYDYVEYVFINSLFDTISKIEKEKCQFNTETSLYKFINNPVKKESQQGKFEEHIDSEEYKTSEIIRKKMDYDNSGTNVVLGVAAWLKLIKIRVHFNLLSLY